MRTLLLCAVVAVCVSGALGARRRLLAGGPPRRPIQRRPFGWPRFRDSERLDHPRRPVPGRVPPQQLQLAPRERFPQAPPPRQGLNQQFQGPYRQEPQQPFGQEPQEPFRQEPPQELEDSFPQEPTEPFLQEPQKLKEPFGQGPEGPFRQEPQGSFGNGSEDPFRQEPQELEDPFRQESQELEDPFRKESEKQFAQKNEVPQENQSPVKKTPALEGREGLATESVQLQERQDFPPLAGQRQAPSFGESELAADSRQDDYSLNIPEKKEEQRLEFQVHGQQGPHSYRFGYDTGSGYNRQFRFEERDADGNLKGRYGYYKDGKLQVVNYSATHEGGFHAEGDFGKFPEKKH